MIRLIIIGVFVFSGCQILNIGSGLSRNHTSNISIYTTVFPDDFAIINSKIKTKIDVFQDSIIISASLGLGIELARVKMTNTIIYIDQILQNRKDSIMMLSLDSKYKLKTIKKLFFAKNLKQDTAAYVNSNLRCLFTDYIEEKGIFFPQKVIIYNNMNSPDIATKQSFTIDYKQIVF